MLDFENELKPLQHELDQMRKRSNGNGAGPDEARLVAQIDDRLGRIYAQLTPWQKVQVARHQERPYALDYLQWAFSDFVELHGDRSFGDDREIGRASCRERG